MKSKLITTKYTCLTIALGYFVVSGLWTLFSGKLFAILLNQPPCSPTCWRESLVFYCLFNRVALLAPHLLGGGDS